MKLYFEKYQEEDIILYEATFAQNNAKQHFQKHVLKSGKKNRSGHNVRYDSSMTEKEYKEAAEELSEMDCGTHDSSENVIGFVYDYQGDPRNVKIRKVSVFNPSYSDVVVYTDDPDFIYTFMLVRKSRLKYFLNNFIDELPENKEDEDLDTESVDAEESEGI